MSVAETVLKASGLARSFGDVRALDGFDLTVPKGRIVGLIGPNGSGKTTALKAILGMSQLDSGELDDRRAPARRQRSGAGNESY